MDISKYIPSSKSLVLWVLTLSLCAMSMLLLSGCQTQRVGESVHDTLIVVKHDTITETKVVKDTESEKMYQSIIERLEKEKSELRTIILSEKGDTIKEIRESVIYVNESKDTTSSYERNKEIIDSVGKYLSRAEALYKAMSDQKTIEKKPSWFERTKNNIFYMVVGIVVLCLSIFGIKKFVLKK